MARERLTALAVAAVAGALLSAPAGAGAAVQVSSTLTGGNENFTVTGDGAADVVHLQGNQTTFTVRRTGDGITETSGLCTDGGDTITCTDPDSPNFGSLTVQMGGGIDQLTNDLTSFGPVTLRGGPGDDTITGSDASLVNEGISGDEGKDSLDGRGGSDSIGGGPDNDELVDGGPGPDFVEGGQGGDVVRGGDGNDLVDGLEILVFGPPVGPDDNDDVDGGNGDDVVIGNIGTGDNVRGGAGDDELRIVSGDGGGDVETGGPGVDLLRFIGPATAPFDNFAANLAVGTAGRINNGPEPDTLGGGIEDVTGASGDDQLTGDAGANRLRGDDASASAFGKDTLDGGPGADVLIGLGNDDTLRSRDGFVDRNDCGDGNDTAEVDQLDQQTECESAPSVFVQPFGTTAPGAAAAAPVVTSADVDRVAPTCKESGLDTSQTPRQFYAGLGFSEECNEPFGLNVTVLARVRGVKRNRLQTSRAGDLVLAENGLSVGGGRRQVRVRPSKAFRRALGSRFRARVRISIFDAAGNVRVAEPVLKVKAAKKKKAKKKGSR